MAAGHRSIVEVRSHLPCDRACRLKIYFRKVAWRAKRRSLDWATRRVPGRRISNTLTTDFCMAALGQAIALYGIPQILNTDQGSQFTDDAFVALTRETQWIALSMDGKGCWRDNVFIERFWKTLKYEEVYLHADDSQRPHSSLAGRTPDMVYFSDAAIETA